MIIMIIIIIIMIMIIMIMIMIMIIIIMIMIMIIIIIIMIIIIIIIIMIMIMIIIIIIDGIGPIIEKLQNHTDEVEERLDELGITIDQDRDTIIRAHINLNDRCEVVCWYTVEPPNRGHIGTGSVILYREVSFIRRLKCTDIIQVDLSFIGGSAVCTVEHLIKGHSKGYNRKTHRTHFEVLP